MRKKTWPDRHRPPPTLLNTRPAGREDRLRQAAERLGWDVLDCPAIRLVCLPPPPRPDVRLWLFTSASAVHCWPWTTPPSGTILTVGPATARAVRQRWPTAMLASLPKQADSEHLLAHPLLQGPPRPIALVKGEGGRRLLETTLRQQGWPLTILPLYRRMPAPRCRFVWPRFRQAACPVLLAMSAETVEMLHTALSAADRRWLTHHPVAALSPRIARRLQQLGWPARLIHIAAKPDISGMIECLEHLIRTQPCLRKNRRKSSSTARRKPPATPPPVRRGIRKRLPAGAAVSG